MPGPIIVTGASGFVGGHLLDRLVDRGPLIAWHRAGTVPPAGFLRAGIEWQAVDLLDRDAVMRQIAATRPSTIFHLAGAPSVESSWQSVVPHLQVNALGTHYLLEGVRLGRPQARVLVVSSAQIYQPSDDALREDSPLLPANPYGLSKLAQDQLALEAAYVDALDIVVARPFNHTGPRQRPDFAVPSFARQIARIEAGLAPPEILAGNLDARRDITDVRDVVDAYDRLASSGQSGRPYNVCSGRAWRIRDLLDELLHLSGVPVTVKTDAARLRPSDIPIVQGDATRLRVELGWTPAIQVEQTLRDTLEAWRERVKDDPNA